MKLHDIAESGFADYSGNREDLINSLSHAVRKMAYYKSRGEDRNTNYDSGIVNRFTPEDEDDLYQIGMLELSRLSPEQLMKYGHKGLLRAVASVMSRGGTKDMRVIGDMPLGGASDSSGGPQLNRVDSETLPSKEKPSNDRNLMLQAINTANISDKAKNYLRMTANGYGTKAVSKVFGVTKNAVYNSIRNAIPQVQQALTTLESRQR